MSAPPDEPKRNYRDEVNKTRPRCRTCPHYIGPTPPMRLDGPGNCMLGPGQVAMVPHQDLVSGVRLEAMTFLPIKHPNGYCGSHPEFFRWWSGIRKQWVSASESEPDSDGTPAYEGRA